MRKILALSLLFSPLAQAQTPTEAENIKRLVAIQQSEIVTLQTQLLDIQAQLQALRDEDGKLAAADGKLAAADRTLEVAGASIGKKVEDQKKFLEKHVPFENRLYHKYNFLTNTGKVLCNRGDIALGGGCYALEADARIRVSMPHYAKVGGGNTEEYSVAGGSGWTCTAAKANGAGNVGIDARVTCLRLAP